MGLIDDERGSIDMQYEHLGQWRPETHGSWLRRFGVWATRSSETSGMRDMCGVMLLCMGLIRTIDGNLFATPQIDYAPAQIWGVIEIIIGVLVLATRSCQARPRLFSRLVASAACGFCLALAVAVYHSSAIAACIHLIIGYVMALEAQVNECK